MKRMRPLLIAAAVVLIAPLQLVAQQGQGRPGGGAMGARQMIQQGSVEFLVTKATDLQLTEEQTTGLTAIGTAWAEATKEDRAKLAAELPQPGQGGGDMQATRERMQALMPVLQKVREADEKAVADAMKLLNETQQATARRLLEERRPPRGPRG